jgi:hypothetical protein
VTTTKVKFTFDDGSVEYIDRAQADAIGHSQLARLLRGKREAQREASARGGDATRDGANVEHKDLDDKIRACFERGEDTRPYVKTWAVEHDVSQSTVYRRIKLLKSQ